MISFQSISASYSDIQNEKVIFDDFSLTIQPGEFITIMGPNGSGKSTLAKLAVGLLPLNSGSILVDNLELTPHKHDNLTAIRRKIGFVFQNPEHQIIATSVEREIAFGLENIGVEREEMVARVDEMLKLFKLEKYRKSSPNLLSGGEKQRVALAGVMAMQPECIIFDEPSSLLDFQARLDLLNLMKTMHENPSGDSRRTIINFTQFSEEALFSDRLIILNHGQICFDGQPTEIFLQIEDLEKTGISPPLEFYVFRELVERYGHVISIHDLLR